MADIVEMAAILKISGGSIADVFQDAKLFKHVNFSVFAID
jgi:hypothetical protein